MTYRVTIVGVWTLRLSPTRINRGCHSNVMKCDFKTSGIGNALELWALDNSLSQSISMTTRQRLRRLEESQIDHLYCLYPDSPFRNWKEILLSKKSLIRYPNNVRMLGWFLNCFSIKPPQIQPRTLT